MDVTTQQVRFERLAEHDYLVSVPSGDDEVLIRLRSDNATVSELEFGGIEEERLVRAIMAYLLARQDADDLPGELDLEDVAAAYDDFGPVVRGSLTE
ncbi:hypothetical protein ABZU76_17575 [Amycolatopsis sp. NPDC005232]|uniref:hypothetical protein n=1 Tax=unclassified Amycolatopsis TaxID=2618356 RepID=UPI001C69F622|nr:hypothetical protein [Amycolatopsis sp. DSM 110486]QYN19317.1 hypothetical protein K1T34_42955 [Amycolatopsis sp. DSM 110486]